VKPINDPFRAVDGTLKIEAGHNPRTVNVSRFPP
jgi:hypothetical protein